MKIAVYTIAKNELQFCERWATACAGADYRIVADTGSTDGTQGVLRDMGVTVHDISVQPWRFDRARDAALALVPADADVCITVDMDEVLADGWRYALEEAWKDGTTRLHYRYVWNWVVPGQQPGVTFMGERCHSRHGYRWVHPVHETLKPVDGFEEHHVWTEGVQIHHYADESKPRSQYRDLLELAVREAPQDDRCAHYYGRELMYYGEHEAAIVELSRHLALPSAQWQAERAASYRYIARCQGALGQDGESALLRACAEAPGEREPWYELAEHYRKQERWQQGLAAAHRCLSLEPQNATYLSEPVCRGSGPYDTASICAWYAGCHDLARELVNIAVSFAPNDQRLLDNKALMEQQPETLSVVGSA